MGKLPVANVVIVTVLDSAEGLAHNEGGLTFLEILAGLDDVEELASFTESRIKPGYYSVTRKQIRSVSHVS